MFTNSIKNDIINYKLKLIIKKEVKMMLFKDLSIYLNVDSKTEFILLPENEEAYKKVTIEQAENYQVLFASLATNKIYLKEDI